MRIVGGRDMVYPLSERQQRAQELAEILAPLDGVWVTSVLPLPESHEFGVQCLIPARNRLEQIIKDAGYTPSFAGMLPRVTAKGIDESGEVWVVSLEKRLPVVDDRPQATIASSVQETEYRAMLKALGKDI